jgi:hypothetical protein
MYPAVHAPPGASRRAIDLKLKPRWRFDTARGLFVAGSGRTFAPTSLPRGSRIVYKVPSLAATDPAKLSGPERALTRYMQVILPAGGTAAAEVTAIRGWPCVEDVSAAPEVSLPARP